LTTRFVFSATLIICRDSSGSKRAVCMCGQAVRREASGQHDRFRASR
jgi:hypothetical protein